MTVLDNSKKDKLVNEFENQQSELINHKSNITIDVDYYQRAIDDPDVSEERKRELIQIIGNIVMCFIDLGFGVHPVQLAQQEKRQEQKQQSEKEQLLERSDV